MFDLMYVFQDWLNQYITFNPIIYDPLKTSSEYLYSLQQSNTIIVYLLWSILLLIFISFCFYLIKTMIYGIMSVFHI